MRRAALAALLAAAACAAPPGAPTERVTIPPRTTFRALTDTLAAHGLVRHPRWFRLVARARGLDRAVRSGTYDVPVGAPAWAVLDLLASGPQALVRFSVREGLTLAEVAEAAEAQLGIPADSFLARTRDTALLAPLGVAAPSLEGFLFPDTYQLGAGATADDVLRAMLAEFGRRWDPAWDSLLAARGLGRLEAVTLASIVEGEARVDDERETIAGVYLNRLRVRMPLQADPTVQYAIQLATGERKPRLFEKDYQFPSPYNTYLNPGLPPGPVNSPSRRSLEAVARPRDVPYFFFVASGDGRHVFTRTYPEHLRAIRAIRGGG